ncbi:MAG: hypothetical protein FWD64_02215 [Acidobacteriaceae bacterium]|nr:hypothetical protein [Acidobacteriaceae bacterium]
MTTKIRYSARQDEKRKVWAISISPKVKYLAELAARASGKTLSGYIGDVLQASFKTLKIELDGPEDYAGKIVRGRTLERLADELYKDTEHGRFLALATIAPWLLSGGEMKLDNILRHSAYFAPCGILHSGRIEQHWTTLAAIRDGEAEIDILPKAQRPAASLSFGLLNEQERVALYKSDPARFKREREAYEKALKSFKSSTDKDGE